MFRNLHGICHVAVSMLVSSAEQAAEAIRRPQGRDNHCRSLYRRQYGLPCWHDLRQMIIDNPNAYISRQQVDIHWHLWKQGFPDQLRALYANQDPLNNAQRPGCSTGNRRDRSHDKLLPPRGQRAAPRSPQPTHHQPMQPLIEQAAQQPIPVPFPQAQRLA